MPIQTPDIVGSYVRGRELGRAVEKERRDAPYLSKLRDLKVSQAEQKLETGQVALERERTEAPYMARMRDLKESRMEQSLSAGRKQSTLQSLAIQDAERKQQSSQMQDIGTGAKWADTPEKWEQFLDINEQEGNDVKRFRGRFDMRDAFIGMTDPDYAKQQKAMENVQTLVQQYPEAQRERAAAIAEVSPETIVKESAKRLADELAGKEKLELKDVSKLNDKVTGLTKKTRDIYSSAESMADLEKNASPAARMAAVFQFMKALDPTSVVRETEQGQVYAAQGPAEAIAGMLNSWIGEGRLTDKGFADLVKTSKVIANTAVTTSEREISDYLSVVRDGISEDQYKNLSGRVPKQFKLDGSDAPSAALEALKANPNMINDFEAKYGYRPSGY